MGSFANSIFRIMNGWLRTAASAVWSAFSSDSRGSLLEWIGKHWILLAVILCLVGVAADLCVYLFRWQPYKVWASFFRRIRKQAPEEAEAEQPEEEEENSLAAAAERAAAQPVRRTPESRRNPAAYDDEPEADLRRWFREEDTGKSAPQPAAWVQVTRAGYSIPEDSPYRRPAGAEPYRHEEREQTRDRIARAIQPKRRRRVARLFTDVDPYAELQAPQEVIDRKEAYHRPVYPKEWGQHDRESNE